jgi:hypothetical protein
LALLAGFTASGEMPWRLRPDLVMTCPATGALFLGDAKETETAGNLATFRRLHWYAVAAAAVSRPGRRVVFALAVPGTRESTSFQDLLDAALAATLRGETATTTEIGDMAVIAVVAAVP